MREERTCSSRLRELAWVATGLIVLVILAYRRVLFLGETFVTSDALTFCLPSREFLAASLRLGRIPEWADWVGFGAPYAANPIHGVTYPPLWLVGVLPASLASDLVLVLHLCIAALGVALYAGSLGASPLGRIVAGALYALGGYVTTVVPNGMGLILAWTPWVAWSADRLAALEGGLSAWGPRAVLLSIFLSLQIMMGEPAQLVVAALLAATVSLARAERPGPALVRFGLAALLAVPLSAVVLLPGSSLLAWSDRSAGLSDQYGSAWSLHPLRLVELLWPAFLGLRNIPFLDLGGLLADTSRGMVPGASWSQSLFLGAPALLLAGFAATSGRVERRLLAASALFVVLALGNLTPVYAALRALPIAGWARYPEKYVAGALLLWAALAGVGFTRAFQAGIRSRGLLVAGVVVTAATGALLLLLALVLREPLVERLHAAALASRYPYDVDRALSVALSSGIVAWFGTAFFAAALAISRFQRAAALATAVVLVGVLFWHGQAMMRTAPRERVMRPPEILEPVARGLFHISGPRPRIALLQGIELAPRELYETAAGEASVLHEHLSANVSARFGLAVLPGFDSVRSAAGRRLWVLLGEAPAGLRVDRLGLVLGVDYAVVPAQSAAGQGLPVLSQANIVSLLAAPARPRAFVAARWAWAPSEEALRNMAASVIGRRGIDPGYVLLAGAGDPAPPGERWLEPLVPCEMEVQRPEDVHLRCGSRLGGYAVLLDQPAPGWTAAVDGRPVAIETADGVFRAVAIGPGFHEIVFTYRTPGLRAGAVISVAAWIACIACAAVLLRARHGFQPPRKGDPSALR